MRRRKQKQCSERSDYYILFVAGIYNLIFVDVSLAGMPLRTLVLLLADLFCIALYVYKREITVLHWKQCRMYEKTMMILLAGSTILVAALAVFGSDYFWISVDAIALLLIYPCIYGRKKFPQDLFCVYSVCSSVICILLLLYYLTNGKCEPFVALLVQNNAVAPWLVLCITMNVIAYCFQERGQVWYGGNVILGSFLLLLQKNVPAMVVVGLVPLMLPIFCRPSKSLTKRAAQAGAMYGFLVCNMSLLTGYTPLTKEIVTYDLEISVYMELLLAAVAVWFFHYWDRYAQDAEEDSTVPEMREWYRKAVIACLVISVGVFATAGTFAADDTSNLQRSAQVLINDMRESLELNIDLFEQMGQRFGMLGIALASFCLYAGIMWVRRTKEVRIKAHKLYRLMIMVFLMQAVFLPQTMATLPVYAIFFFLFMGAEEKQQQKIKLNPAEGQRQMTLEEKPQNNVAKTEEQPQSIVSGEEEQSQSAVSKEEEQPQKETQDDGFDEKECNGIDEDTTEQLKGENADEANHSDTVLQRGGDAGNRAKRSSKKIRRHRPDRISDHQ